MQGEGGRGDIPPHESVTHIPEEEEGVGVWLSRRSVMVECIERVVSEEGRIAISDDV